MKTNITSYVLLLDRGGSKIKVMQSRIAPITLPFSTTTSTHSRAPRMLSAMTRTRGMFVPGSSRLNRRCNSIPLGGMESITISTRP